MDLDTLLERYFASADLAAIDEATLARGCEQLGIDFGVEQEPSRKFALWVLMEALGIAPPPAEAFAKDRKLRTAAEDWQRQSARLGRD